MDEPDAVTCSNQEPNTPVTEVACWHTFQQISGNWSDVQNTTEISIDKNESPLYLEYVGHVPADLDKLVETSITVQKKYKAYLWNTQMSLLKLPAALDASQESLIILLKVHEMPDPCSNQSGECHLGFQCEENPSLWRYSRRYSRWPWYLLWRSQRPQAWEEDRDLYSKYTDWGNYTNERLGGKGICFSTHLYQWQTRTEIKKWSRAM